ncbi:hypothetical protein C8E01_107112 [Pontibacter virosus]|uniref:Uncharacterized protein n=1 Tax=Pontibacter virosus TaxID=1765052 RepID=A0A2U1AVU7_9BACT|nr:hypothetical protein C8E01_107112 [Pontibacter virosus]
MHKSRLLQRSRGFFLLSPGANNLKRSVDPEKKLYLPQGIDPNG